MAYGLGVAKGMLTTISHLIKPPVTIAHCLSITAGGRKVRQIAVARRGALHAAGRAHGKYRRG